MRYTAETLTPDVLVQLFGDSKDWCSVFKNGSRVGYFQDLRKQVLKKQALNDKNEKKKFHDQIMKNTNIKEAKKFFEDRIKNGEVFINETQPNIHINGSKVYIICGNTPKIRMSITHKELEFDDMQIITERKGTPSTSKNHILFDALDLEEAAEIITTLCGK